MVAYPETLEIWDQHSCHSKQTVSLSRGFSFANQCLGKYRNYQNVTLTSVTVSEQVYDSYCGQERGEDLAEYLPSEDNVDAHAVLDVGPRRVDHAHDKVLGQLRRPSEVKLRLGYPDKLVGVALEE